MNKTELKELIKEEIIDILSEASKADIKAQQDINKELESTVTSLAFAGVIADAAVGVTAFGFLTIPASTL